MTNGQWPVSDQWPVASRWPKCQWPLAKARWPVGGQRPQAGRWLLAFEEQQNPPSDEVTHFTFLSDSKGFAQIFLHKLSVYYGLLSSGWGQGRLVEEQQNLLSDEVRDFAFLSDFDSFANNVLHKFLPF